MRTPLPYRMAGWVVRAILRLYFRSVEVVGRGRIPPGPVVVAANHPESITDAWILGLGVGRMLHFLGHSGLFRNPVQAFFLRSFGVIPVYHSGGEDNREMFRACFEALERGGAIGMFPEGISKDEPKVQPLRTGAARIVLEGEARRGFTLGAAVVPAGLSFERPRRFRGRVLVRFGAPIPASDFAELYARDPYEAVHAMTARLEDSIGRLVLNLSHVELGSLVRDIERFFADDLEQEFARELLGTTRFQRRQELAREVGRAVDHFESVEPDRIDRLEQKLSRYRKRLRAAGLQDVDLRRETGRWSRETVRLVWTAALGLIPAAYGALWNGLPYKITGWAAKRTVRDATKFHFHQIAWGSLFYPLYYVPLLLLVYGFLGGTKTVLFVLTLIPTGFFARWYGRLLGRKRRAVRVAYLEATRGFTVPRLRKARQELHAELDAAANRYLAARKSE